MLIKLPLLQQLQLFIVSVLAKPCLLLLRRHRVVQLYSNQIKMIPIQAFLKCENSLDLKSGRLSGWRASFFTFLFLV